MNTFGELCDRYRTDAIHKLGVRTQRDYVRHVTFLEAYFGRDRVLSTIKARDVGRFLDVSTGKIHRNKQAAVLSAMMGMAVGVWFADDCDVNPCVNVVHHYAPPRTRYVSDEEFKAVHDLAPPSVQLAMRLALLTGQRQGDILDLTWHKVMPDHIRIVQSKTGKSLGIRITPALSDVLQACRKYKQFAGPRLYLIRTKNGEPYSHEGFRALWQIVMGKAVKSGVIRTRYTFHDLRAKCASDKGNLQDASALLGHSDVGLTRRIYDRNMRMVDPLK